MFKFSSLLIVFFFISNNLFSSKIPYNENVKGGYKSLTVISYNYNNGKIDTKSEQKQVSNLLDKYGYSTEIQVYDKNEIVNRIFIENSYNDEMLTRSVYKDEAGNVIWDNSFVYDKDKNCIKSVKKVIQNNYTTISHYKFDKNGFLIEEYSEIEGDNQPSSPTYYVNDKFGNKIEEKRKNSVSIDAEVETNTNLEEKSTKSKTEVKTNNEDEYVTVKYIYTYDEKGRILSSKQINTDLPIYKNEYRYDEFGNRTEEILFDEKEIPYTKYVNRFIK